MVVEAGAVAVVTHGRPRFRMPRQVLHLAQGRARLQRVGDATVPEEVWRERGRDTCAFPKGADDGAQPLSAQRPPSRRRMRAPLSRPSVAASSARTTGTGSGTRA